MGPIDNRIHLGLGISPELSWQNASVTNSLFSGPFFYPKRSPGQNVDLGSQNVFPCFLKKVWNWAGACPYPSAPSKVSMFGKILTTGSLYMSIWGPKTIFNPTKWANPGLGLFKDSYVARMEGSCMPRKQGSCVPRALVSGVPRFLRSKSARIL